MQLIHRLDKIFSEWLPNCKDYEIAAGYNIEMYTALSDYPKGNQDKITTAKFGFLLRKNNYTKGRIPFSQI